MPERAIFDILSTDTAVIAIVEDRIAPISQAQFTAFPFITFTVVGYDPTITQAGVIVGAKTTIQVVAWAKTYRAAFLLQIKIRQALTFKRGIYGACTVNTISVQGRSSLDEQLGDGGEKPSYAVSQDYTVLHKE